MYVPSPIEVVTGQSGINGEAAVHAVRVSDPTRLDLSQLKAFLVDEYDLTIQFSIGNDGVAQAATPALLQQLEAFCQAVGPRVTVRFYGGHGAAFACDLLAQLPSVAALRIETNTTSNLEAVATLTALQRLSIKIADTVPRDLLHAPNLQKLTSLELGKAQRGRFDLTALAAMPHLTELLITDHANELSHVAHVPTLTKLTLWSPRGAPSLAFVRQLPALRELALHWGSYAELDELDAPQLQRLRLQCIRGLTKFDARRLSNVQQLSLDRFAQLTRVRVNQLQQLQRLRITDATKCSVLDGISELPSLATLRLYRTATDLDALLQAGLPTALREFAYLTGRTKADNAIAARLQALGYDAR
ncbi:MAG TPA: hypothetical protein PLF40_18155 [Kofleriaceae bacterium]|nr:hypothetical protein [Kofleriaceae bacterium]